MKNLYSFLSLLLIILFVFACKLQFPEAVEIKGSLELKPTINMDLSEKLSTFIMESFEDEEDISILECTNTALKELTYLIHLDLLKDEEISVPEDFLDDMDELIDEMVDDYIEENDLFNELLEEIDEEALDRFLTELFDEGLHDDKLDVPNEFEWNGATVVLDRDEVLASFKSTNSKEELKAKILEEGEGAAEETISDIVKDAIKESVRESIKTTTVFVRDADLVLYDNFDEPISIPLEGISDSLKGFKFSELKARLYISVVDEDGNNADIIEELEIKLSFNDPEIDDIHIKKEGENKLTSSKSNVNLAASTYNGLDLPNPTGGIDLKDTFMAILESEGEVEITFEVFIPEDTGLSLDFIDKVFYASAELVIWLPLKLTAGEDAEFVLPFDFAEEGEDLFGRNAPTDKNQLSEIVKSFGFSITLSDAVFNGVTLSFASGDLEFLFPITGKKMEIKISEANLKEINDPVNFPFTPELKIKFEKDKTLQIPRNLNAVSVSLAADLDIRYEF